MAEYLELGAWQEVLKLGRIAPADPMNCYYRAYAAAGLGKEAKAADFLTQAGEMSPDYCFPYTDMDRRVLQYAFAQRKDGGKSAYYLGCLFYGRDNREEGVKCWEVSVTREDGLHQAHRCMALALLEVFEDKVGNGKGLCYASRRAVSSGAYGNTQGIRCSGRKAAGAS